MTLEPCAHHGQTPPCAEALVAARVRRVVIGTGDPDPRVDGGGIAILRAAGIEVETGVRRAEAEDVAAGFLTRVRKGRPLVELKSATTIDGRIAAASGESRWITGPAAREAGHLLRARSDAVMVGIGTAIADDPELTVRLPGLGARKPVRIVADARLRLPLTSKLARGAKSAPLWMLVRADGAPERKRAFRDLGAEVIDVPAVASGELDLDAAMAELGARGLTRVLVEGGGRIAGALMRRGLVDRIACFRAGLVMGGDGLPSVAAMGVAGPAAAPRFDLIRVERIGEDVLETWAARA